MNDNANLIAFDPDERVPGLPPTLSWLWANDPWRRPVVIRATKVIRYEVPYVAVWPYAGPPPAPPRSVRDLDGTVLTEPTRAA